MANNELHRSAFQEAAALPPGAPHILEVDETAAPASDEDVVCVIDIDEYEDELRDPAWRDFLKRATEYSKRLRAEGRMS